MKKYSWSKYPKVCIECGTTTSGQRQKCRSCGSRASKWGSRNPMWKGDNVTGVPLHKWVRRNFPKPEKCQICKIKPPFDLANISPKYDSTTYNREFKNWRWLCRSYHMKEDGRLENLRQYKRLSLKPL